MGKTDKISIMTIAAVLAAVLLCGCTSSGNAADGGAAATTAVVENNGAKAGSSEITESPGNEATAVPTQDAAVEGLSVTTEVQNGWTVLDGVYTITEAGEYTFSGSLAEGRIVVKAGDAEVSVILDGVELSSEKNSVIFVESAGEVTIVAKGGSVNTLNDNRPRKETRDDAAGNACIYSKDDMAIQGKGTLNVNASYNKGIHCKNDIKIKNLTLNVTAPGTAIQGNDSIEIKSGTLTLVSTEGDGLKTKNTDISSKGKQRGVISVESGEVNITAADECIDAAYAAEISTSSDTVVTRNKY